MRILIAAAALLMSAAGAAAAEDLSHCQTAQAAMAKTPVTARTEFKACLAKGALTPQSAAITHMNLAVLALGQKSWNEVISEYAAAEKAITASGKVFQPDAVTLYNRGVARAELRQFKNAKTDLDAAVKLEPKQMPIRITRMSVLAALGDANGALADGAVLAAQPEKNWQLIGHARRGGIFEATKRFPEAFAETEAILKLEPGNPEVLISRVGLLRAMNKEDQILADTEVLLKSDAPKAKFAAHTIRGSLFDENHKYDQALAEADAAIAIDAKEPVGHNNRCMALANLGRPDDAVASCQKAMTIAPKAPIIWNSMGYALEKGGKLAEARTYYQKVLAAEPRNEANAADLKRVELALGVAPTPIPVAKPAAAKPTTIAAKPATPSGKPTTKPGEFVFTPAGQLPKQ